MRALHPRHYFAIVLGLAGLAVAFVWRTAPASAMDPPPPFPLYLPVIQVPPPHQLPSASFFAVNGGPIDGNTGTGAYDGELA
jgi:hypothetical protein